MGISKRQWLAAELNEVKDGVLTSSAVAQTERDLK